MDESSSAPVAQPCFTEQWQLAVSQTFVKLCQWPQQNTAVGAAMLCLEIL